MDRRRFMQAAAAATGSVALGGCLGGEEDPVPEIGPDPQRYDLPAYSELTPAETQAGGGVVFLHLRLAVIGAVQQAAMDGQLPAGPLVELPLAGVGTVADAVATLSSYPFAAPLRQAVTAAAGPLSDGSAFSSNGTVAPENESVSGNTTNQTATDDPATTEERTDTLGIDVTDITLIDGLLIFHGRFDRQVIADRYTEGFQQVDQQRGMRIYEGGEDRSGQGFAVAEEMLVVPTENSSLPAAETRLAHSLSGYISTLGRVVDDKDGQWLFETTGPAAVSLGVWGDGDPFDLIAERVGSGAELSVGGGPVFGSVGGFISVLEASVDPRGTVSAVEGRFAGVFTDSMPTEDELQTSLLSTQTAAEVVLDAPRAHLTTSFEDA